MDVYQFVSKRLPKSVVITGCILSFIGLFFICGGAEPVEPYDETFTNPGWYLIALGSAVLFVPIGIMSLMNRIKNHRRATSSS